MDVTEVRVDLFHNSRNPRLLAFCSITFDHVFVVHDVKLIHGHKGAFVAMPDRKQTDRCPSCSHRNHLRASYCNHCGNVLDAERCWRDGDDVDDLHVEIAHPITNDCRKLLHAAVLSAYAVETKRVATEQARGVIYSGHFSGAMAS